MPAVPHTRPARVRGRHRGRAAALTACLGLTASLSPGLLTGAAHAAPAEDCAVPFPISELERGDDVTGLTVSAGTTPDGFTGEVLGVVKDGIFPGLDMVMARLDSPAIEEAGIWAGMSGSPVYAEDGRLIGAVSYVLSSTKSPIAGITPFEAMKGYIGGGGAGIGTAAGAPNKHVKVDKRTAKLLAATGEVTAAQASAGFRQAPMPMSVSGLRQSWLDDLKSRTHLSKNVRATGSGGGADVSVDTVVAGGNLAVAISNGDVTVGGVGTATSVCEGEVVGFGHPMEFTGKAEYALAAADTVLVQPDDLWGAFKVVNFGQPGGTITDDRIAGIAGHFQETPDAVRFTSDLTYGTKQRSGVTDVYLPNWLADVALYGAYYNHLLVMDSYSPGSERQTWQLKGTDESGKPFTIKYDDLFSSTYSIAEDGAYPIADALWRLSNFPGVTLDSAVAKGEISDEAGYYRITKLEQKVGGDWMKVKTKASVKAGGTLQLRATLTPDSGTKTKTVKISQPIPAKLAGSTGQLRIVGGDSEYLRIWRTSNLAEFKKALKDDPRNDAVAVDGTLGKGAKKVTVDLESSQVDRTVSGRKSLTIIIK